MSKDDSYLLDILTASRRAVEAAEGHTLEELEEDWKNTSVIQHQLMIVGEAVKRLSTQIRERYPEVPWKAMARRRDLLIHRYDDVEIEEIWRIVKEDLPELIKFLESIIPRNPQES